MERRLLVNRIQTPDGTILTSKFRHDFVSYIDENGDMYYVDGGTDYQRTSENKEPAKNLCLYSDDPFEEIRKYFTRGTFDEEGNRIWKPLCELSNKHLTNIISYNLGLFEEGRISKRQCDEYNELMTKELDYRKEHDIYIEDNFPY